MDNQIDRNTVYIIFKAAFIFKATTEARRFKKFQEARNNAASDIHAAKRSHG
nr:Uncharacterised protein [Salmonella sp. NCTC 7297]